MNAKQFTKTAAIVLVALGMMASCDRNKDPKPQTKLTDIDYTNENAGSWKNYMLNVVRLLNNDATALYDDWTLSFNGGEAFAATFKNHSGSYATAANCIQEMIDGCIDIANEVGTAKIKDPYDLYISGHKEEGLYAVESWYSWHSRDDYTNNIYSIRNTYFGSLDNTVSEKSLSAAIKASDANLDAKVVAAINDAARAIQAIPQPFRNNIDSKEAEAAMEACEALTDVLEKELKPAAGKLSDAAMEEIVENFVDEVVVPTYKMLRDRFGDLKKAVEAFVENPSDAAFKAGCEAWLSAREPWEKSEAFLFGPVDSEALDPNMDSWPLDVEGIVNVLNSGKWADMEWNDGDSDEAVEAAQGVRGFHTLEFLLFKNGQPREIK